MNASLLWRWLNRIPHETSQWILHATPLWLVLAVPLAIWLLIGLFSPSPEIQLEASGLVLQILGLFVIAHGLNALRKELRDDEQGFGAAIFVSLKRFGRIFYPIRRPAILAVGSGHAHASGQIVGVSVKSGELNGRVEALEQEMRSVRDKIREMERDTDSRLKELTERSERNQESQRERFASAHLKGLTPELVAIIWIVLGMSISSFPEKIATTVGLG